MTKERKIASYAVLPLPDYDLEKGNAGSEDNALKKRTPGQAMLIFTSCRPANGGVAKPSVARIPQWTHSPSSRSSNFRSPNLKRNRLRKSTLKSRGLAGCIGAKTPTP